MASVESSAAVESEPTGSALPTAVTPESETKQPESVLTTAEAALVRDVYKDAKYLAKLEFKIAVLRGDDTLVAFEWGPTRESDPPDTPLMCTFRDSEGAERVEEVVDPCPSYWAADEAW